MKCIFGTDYARAMVVNSIGPAIIYGVEVLVADESCDPHEFYAGATAPPLSNVIKVPGLALGTAYTYRVEISRKSDGVVVVDQPAVRTTLSSGETVLSYGWTAGAMAAGTYWYKWLATAVSDGRVLPLGRKLLQVRTPL